MAESLDLFRAAHESQRANLVRPHVTLVFGLKTVQPMEFLAFCTTMTGHVSELAVEFDTTEIVYDHFENSHKLLVKCSIGEPELMALHAKLYDGPHRVERHSELSYRPHMTVATNEDRSVLERLDAGEIGTFPIFGMIKSLAVVEIAAGTLRPLGTIALQT